jgi:PleD family two-component response regulator
MACSGACAKAFGTSRTPRSERDDTLSKGLEMIDATNLGTAEKPSKTNGSAKTVMVVEDNDLNMKLFHDLLEAHGYNILQTKDGMEALKLAREHRPDLILMDIQLPEAYIAKPISVTNFLQTVARFLN